MNDHMLAVLQQRLSDVSVQIGITSFNEGKGLIDTLRSLADSARYCGIERPEFILSDSSRTAETSEHAQRWGESNELGFIIDRSATRRSKKSALDVLFERATADLLVYVDADVLIPSMSLAWMLWDMTEEPGPEVAVGVVLAEPGYRGTWRRAGAWQMKVARRVCRWAPRDSVHAQGAFTAFARNFYMGFRYAGLDSDLQSTISDDTALARYLETNEIPARNSWRAVALKVPTGNARDFYLQTYRAYFDTESGFRRPKKDFLAALVEGTQDPVGAAAYLYARWAARREARKDPARFDSEAWPVSDSTKR